MDMERQKRGSELTPYSESQLSGSIPKKSNLRVIRSSPYIVTNGKLSSRADVWIFACLSSCAATASLSMTCPPPTRSIIENAALSLSAISTAVSFAMACVYRYRPSRSKITKRRNCCRPCRTSESIVALIHLHVWCALSAIVLHADNYLATAGSHIWNANLYFSTWIGFGTSAYLVADVFTIGDPSGVVQRNYRPDNVISKSWALLLIASAALVSFSAAWMMGSYCQGRLRDTRMCRQTMLGVIFGILGVLSSGAYFAVMTLESALIITRIMRHVVGSLLSFVALACFTTNVSLLTSPGGPGSEPSNIYFASWICFMLALYLCVRHMELYLAPHTPPPVASVPIKKMTRVPSVKSVSTDSQYTDDGEEYTAPQTMDDDPMLFLPSHYSSDTSSLEDEQSSSYPSRPTYQPAQQYGHQHNQGPYGQGVPASLQDSRFRSSSSFKNLRRPKLSATDDRPDPAFHYEGDPTKPDADAESLKKHHSFHSRNSSKLEAPSIDLPPKAPSSNDSSSERKKNDVDGILLRNSKNSVHYTDMNSHGSSMNNSNANSLPQTTSENDRRRAADAHGIKQSNTSKYFTELNKHPPHYPHPPPPPPIPPNEQIYEPMVSNSQTHMASDPSVMTKSKSSRSSKSSKSSKSGSSDKKKKKKKKKSSKSSKKSDGPPTVSDDSYVAARGPPTVSYSGNDDDDNNDDDDDTDVESMTPSTMNRPLRSITPTENQSIVSEPTIEGFGNLEDHHHMFLRAQQQQQHQQQQYHQQRRAQNSQSSLQKGYSAATSVASSQTDNHRRGAVDKMVMEALKQAQEARNNSQHGSSSGERRYKKSANSSQDAKSIHSFYSQGELSTSMGGGAFAC